MENLTLFPALLSFMMLVGVIGFLVVAIMAVVKLRLKNYTLALVIFGVLAVLSLVLLGIYGAYHPAILSLMMFVGAIGFLVVAIMAVVKLRLKNYTVALIIFGALVVLAFVLLGGYGASGAYDVPAILP